MVVACFFSQLLDCHYSRVPTCWFRIYIKQIRDAILGAAGWIKDASDALDSDGLDQNGQLEVFWGLMISHDLDHDKSHGWIHGETSPCPLVSTSFERAEARCQKGELPCAMGTWLGKKLRLALALIIWFPENFLGPSWPVGGSRAGDFRISDLDENWRKRTVDLRDVAGNPRISSRFHGVHRSLEWIPWIWAVISGFGAQAAWAATGETESGSWLWIVVSFLAGGLCVSVRYSVTGSNGSRDAPKPLLNTMLQQTHGAAVLYAITAAGFMDVMPLPSEEPLTAAELLRRNRQSGTKGKEAVLQQLLHLLATCEILEEREDRHSAWAGGGVKLDVRWNPHRRDEG